MGIVDITWDEDAEAGAVREALLDGVEDAVGSVGLGYGDIGALLGEGIHDAPRGEDILDAVVDALGGGVFVLQDAEEVADLPVVLDVVAVGIAEQEEAVIEATQGSRHRQQEGDDEATAQEGRQGISDEGSPVYSIGRCRVHKACS